MAIWGTLDQANNAPTFSGDGAISANGEALYGNTTLAASINNAVVGVYGVDQTEAGLAGNKGKGGAGWVKVITGTGPITDVSANSSTGSGYVNGASVMFSGGTAPARALITSNATGNVVSVTLFEGGAGFVANTTAVANVTQKYVTTVTVSASGNGYVNGEAVVISNGTINALGVLVTNAAGNIASVTLSDRGVFAPAKANADAVVTILTVAGAGATLVANLDAGSGANVFATTLGGRAGRRTYENLVALKITAEDGDDTLYPDS